MFRTPLFFLALVQLFVCPAFSQEKPKPSKTSPGITVVVEYIEVNHETFSDHQLNNPLKRDATELRKEVQKWVKAGQGKIRETLIVQTRSGQRAKVEAVREIMYPGKYEFPPVPLVKQEKDKNGNVKKPDLTLPILPIIPPTPTAFETRKVGTTLEVDAVLSADHSTIDLSIAPEWVVLLPRREWENKLDDRKHSVETPTFHVSRMTTSLTLDNGSYAFLGTNRMAEEQSSKDLKDPILLVFVKADAY